MNYELNVVPLQRESRAGALRARSVNLFAEG